MSNYRRGYAFEKRVKADLEKRGWTVIDSRGSHGTVDMVALKAEVVSLSLGSNVFAGGLPPGIERTTLPPLLIQAKRTLRRLRFEEWNALLDLATHTGAMPIVASMPGVRGVQYHLLVERREARTPIEPHQIREYRP